MLSKKNEKEGVFNVKINVTQKLTALILCFSIFVMISYSAVFFLISKEKVKESAGVELFGCASITTGLITADMLEKIPLGDKKVLEEARTALDWVVDHKPIFRSALVVDENGKILIADKRFLNEGIKEGQTYYVDKEVLKMAEHKHHDTYSDIYDVDGHKRMAGYAKIDNGQKQKAYMLIEFDASIITKRTMDMVIPAVGIGWIFPVIGAAILYVVIRRGVKPLLIMIDEVGMISKGDLSFEPNVVKSKDEIGTLSISIKNMVNNLADLIGKMNKTGQELTHSSNLLNTESKISLNSDKKIAQDIIFVSEGSKDQLFQTKESAAAMDEISSQVVQVAKNSVVMKDSTANTSKAIQQMAESIEQVSNGSQHASKLAEEVQNDAIVGKGNVDLSKEEMLSISEIIQDASNVIQNLGKSSQEIGRIVEVIDSIAEQTNLLALNAAIEAARAGEHGKGFSVVADEVKNLAERSVNATKEIATLIKGIQEETQIAVKAIQTGNFKVEEGNRLAEEASLSIEKIVNGINKISKELTQISDKTSEQSKESDRVVAVISTLEEQVNQVAKATQEQTIGVNEITKSISKIAEISQNSTHQLDDVVESSKKSADSIEKISANAQMLENLSKELQEAVGEFKLKK